MKIRFGFIAVCLVVDLILSALFVAMFWARQDTIVLWIGGTLTLLYPAEVVGMCLFWHRAWRAIQGPAARTTPGKAVGFMFIPFFNLYWAFQLIWGFAKDTNAFCDGRGDEGPAQRLDARYYLGVVIMWIVLVVLRYLPLVGHLHVLLVLRYNPTIGVIYGMCFSLAMLVLLYKTARAVERCEGL